MSTTLKVFRKLLQFVPEFDAFLLNNSLQNIQSMLISSCAHFYLFVNVGFLLGNLTRQEGAELLGARMVGCWKSGAPVDLSTRR